MTFRIVGAFRSVAPRRICGAALLGLGLMSPAFADSSQNQNDSGAEILSAQFIADVGGSQRINFSGKLRMLSQRVVANACYIHMGVTPEQSQAALQATVAEFGLITNALEFGNDDLGIIGPEDRRRTLAGIAKLNELWAPIEARATVIAEGQGTADDVTEIATQSGPLLDIAVRLVSQISGQYSNPAALLQADALVIDIAGRQRMLSQRMSKNVCLLAAGINEDVARGELEGARNTFDASLNALYHGMPDAGVQPPPTDDIETNLAAVITNWNGLKPIVDQELSGQTLDAEQLAIMFSGANGMTGDMNTIVGMYSEASKLGL